MDCLERRFAEQLLANGYELVDGVAMHAANGERFQIPHPVLKKHVSVGHFVEIRVDSSRFSVHPNAPDNCTCPHCNEETSKPILSHQHPASLVKLPKQQVPSRGWGEEFWVQIEQRDGEFFQGVVDNPLFEARLHGLREGESVLFHSDHILAIHGVHRQELMTYMDAIELKQLAQWLGSMKK